MINSSLLALLHLTDPTLPIGGFAHSAGLETYVQKGLVNDKISAKNFVVQMLTQNLHYTDAAFVSLAYEAAREKNIAKIISLDNECTAVKLPMEIRQASQKLGMRLLKIFQPLYNNPMAAGYRHLIETRKAGGHYSVVFGMYAQISGIKKEDTLTGFYYNVAVGMVTNCVKLIPLGQQDGQELLFSLQPLIQELALQSLEPDRDKIGLCCTGFDIRCMQHEVLYSRLYMS